MVELFPGLPSNPHATLSNKGRTQSKDYGLRSEIVLGSNSSSNHHRAAQQQSCPED
jgi:hypothetical protein